MKDAPTRRSRSTFILHRLSAPTLPQLPASRFLIPVRKQLLAWFDEHARKLPWRRDRDPYHIWVSEIMLQQTQVATVTRYFERFMQRFPTLIDLANADEQEVLRLWQGLGYYRRARHLHSAARRLAHGQRVANPPDGRPRGPRTVGPMPQSSHGASVKVPNDPEFLRRLPGMGRYTVAAVLSQAFDRRLPVLEANSERVLSRFLGLRADPRRGPARRWLWQAAEALLPPQRVGDFNQAIMEVGALVCTPRAPRCDVCPLTARCVARKLQLQAQLPARSARPKTEETREAAVIIRRGRKVLLVQRPESGRWPNMWEFPHRALGAGETYETAAQRLIEEWTNLRAVLGSEWQTIRHSVTRFRITLVCFEAFYSSGRFASQFYADARWLDVSDLDRFPISTPQRRLMSSANGLTSGHQQTRLF